jgi:hypothetical protein
MAAKKGLTPTRGEERIIIKIDRIPGQKEQDDVVIEVNGKRYQIQRGVEVAVPSEVAAAFELWQRERADAEKFMFERMN